jgi:hypothetical protein
MAVSTFEASHFIAELLERIFSHMRGFWGGPTSSGNREPEAPINTALRRFPTSSCPSVSR